MSPRQKAAVLTVQIKFRISEVLRRRLEAAAKKRGAPISSEIVRRLDHSFGAPAVRAIEDVAADMTAIWDRFSKAQHEANKLGDLVRATEALLHATTSIDSQPVRSARAQVEIVIRAIDAEAAMTVRRAHTTGAE
jgi:hypothetical protein